MILVYHMMRYRRYIFPDTLIIHFYHSYTSSYRNIGGVLSLVVALFIYTMIKLTICSQTYFY